MSRLLLPLLALVLAVPATAQPTSWTLIKPANSLDYSYEAIPGQDRVGTTAHAIRTELEAGTAWLRGLGFDAPLVAQHEGTFAAQIRSDGTVDAQVGSGAIAVFRSFPDRSEGDLWLRRSALDSIEVDGTGALLDRSPDGDGESLATAVHEVFHGVQAAYRSPYGGDNWIWEGMAEAVMHEWMRVQGRPYTLRETDYTDPLTVWDEDDDGNDREHFWLSVGALLGGDDRVGYLRHVLRQPGDWEGAPVATADAALRAAADALDAIGPYRDGLYDLYPQVIAQHAGPEHFASVPAVDLGTPASTTGRGELGPLTSHALHVRVDVDEDRLDARGLPVRLTLDVTGRDAAAVGDDDPRDALHLIEGTTVAGRPALAETPYTHVVRVDSDTTLFVRVANVAPEPAAGGAVAYTLTIESEGYFIGVVDAEGIAAPLPPGFVVNGPGPWDCRGGASARAVFDLMTPDELARDVERALPEFGQDMGDMMDQLEIDLQRAQRRGRDPSMTREQMTEAREQIAEAREQIAALRPEAEAALAEAEREHGGEIARAADDVRAEPNTLLGATFVGSEAGADCQMTLAATLLGREGGAQILPGAVDADRYPDGDGPDFGVMVYPEAFLRQMQGMGATMEGFEPGRVPAGLAAMDDPMDGWQVCTMTDEERRRARESASDCPPVLCTTGQLVLETAEQGRIAGSFQFEVLQWPNERTGRCRVPTGRDTVTGHFNVASTDDGTDDNSLGGIGTLPTGGTLIVPGTPILEFDLDD